MASLSMALLVSISTMSCGATSPARVTVIAVGPSSLAGAPGQSVALVLDTDKNATCDIVVLYPSGPSQAAGLVPRHADAQGRLSWTWTIDTNAPTGTHPIFVRCHAGNAEAGLDATLEVIRPVAPP